jgi:wobble nucleotide-excising tRNase
MIHKIERLVSVGKFRNYLASGHVAFNKLTLVYADNGCGKTTLTSVLRSLSEAKPEIVRKRISTNSTAAQTAQIVKREGAVETHHTLRPSGWSNPFPNIEIFDIHFVNENIYSGFDFSEDQREGEIKS